MDKQQGKRVKRTQIITESENTPRFTHNNTVNHVKLENAGHTWIMVKKINFHP